MVAQNTNLEGFSSAGLGKNPQQLRSFVGDAVLHFGNRFWSIDTVEALMRGGRLVDKGFRQI
jgi:hypothetical protein